jgi:NADH-quinone oxidoreductase subunit J
MTPPLLYAASAICAVGLLLLLKQPTGKARLGATILGLAGLAWLLVQAVQASGALGFDPRVAVMSLAVAMSTAAAVRVITTTRPVFAALYFVLVVVAGAVAYLVLGAEFMAFSLIIVYAGAILITYMFVLMLAQQAPDAGGPSVAYDRIAREPAAAVLCGFVLLAVLASGMQDARTNRLPQAAIEARANAAAWTRMRGMPELVQERVTAELAAAGKDPMGWTPSGTLTVAQDGRTAMMPVTLADGSTHETVLKASDLPVNSTALGWELVTSYPGSLELAGVILLMAMLGAVVLARRQTDMAEDDRRAAAGLSRVNVEDADLAGDQA